MYARDFTLIATPIGTVRLLGTSECIETISIEAEQQAEVRARGALAEGAEQVRAYFCREANTFRSAVGAPDIPARGSHA